MGARVGMPPVLAFWTSPLRASAARLAEYRPYRDQAEMERKFVVVELAERWLVLVSRAILLLLTLAMGITPIICALRGSTWPPPAGMGGSSVVAGAAARFERSLGPSSRRRRPTEV
jgi:hypothetical protein